MGVVEVLDPVAPTRAGGWKVDVSRGERNGRVSSEWFNRPDDERYLSLDDLWASVKGRSERSRCRVVQTADIRVAAAHTAPSGCFGKVVSMIRPAALGRTRTTGTMPIECSPGPVQPWRALQHRSQLEPLGNRLAGDLLCTHLGLVTPCR